MAEDDPQKLKMLTPVCAIGASAGGITALRELFRDLPDSLGLAYVVIMHLAPDHPSALSEILGSSTKMPVQQVEDGPTLRPNCVYVIAPDRELVIDGDDIKSRPFSEPRGRRAPIDMFFRSVARGRGDGMAVILSGAGSDGALGVAAIKEAGGVVFVQDPADAEYPMMPRSALSSGVADFVAPIPRLVERMIEVAQSKEAVKGISVAGIDDNLRRIIGFLRARTGHDFSSYKRATVMRRVLRRVQVTRRQSPADYADYLITTPEEAQELFADLLISVTMFFRDPDAFTRLAENAVGPVFDEAGEHGIRAWVVGCATGEEAYSVAIILLEEAERRRVTMPIQIFATDLDEGALATAREGRYPAAIEADVSQERLQRFFVKEGSHYRIKKEVRDTVLFATHSVLKEPPFLRLDLVTCRNLLIYLERGVQRQVCAVFHYGLRPGGCLFLGSAETIDSPELFFPTDREARIYSARAQTPRSLPMVAQLAEPHHPHPSPLGRMPYKVERDRDAGARHFAALEQAAPPSILVNQDYQVLHLSPTAGRYIQPSAGPVSTDLIALVRRELRLDLVSTLRRAFDQADPVLSLPVVVDFDGVSRRILMQVAPGGGRPPSQALLLFIDAGAPAVDDSTLLDERPDDEVSRLREALRASEEHLGIARRDHEGAIQDLRIANEELQSINEEYRSTSEELETSKEELQSMNEELLTVNAELKSKLDNISRSHSDLQNLIGTTEVFTLFLDPELRIRMFTPGLAGLFNITESDTGRVVTDFTHHLHYDSLHHDAVGVLRELAPVEREIGTDDGRWLIIRFRPYRTVDDKIDGVVVTFVDVTELRRATASLRKSELQFRALVRATNDAIFRMTPDWTALLHLEGGRFEPHTQGLPSTAWMDTYLHPDERPAVQTAIQEAMASKGVFQLEHRVRRADGSFGWTFSRAVPLIEAGDYVSEWFGALSDVSERHLAEEQLLQTKDLLGLANAASRLGWGAWDLPDGAAEWDDRARAILGLAGSSNRVGDWLARIHPDDRAKVTLAMAESARSGGPFDIEYRVVHPAGQVRVVQGTGMVPQVSADGSGRATGLVRDITRQKELEETQLLLMGELSHRVKNMLAVVQSIAHQTERTSDNMATFVDRFAARMQALGRAHSLLTDANWRGTTLEALARDVLMAFRKDGLNTGINLRGPNVVLAAGATISLTMALHELGTNALKYGALSVPSGSVALSWNYVKTGELSSLHLVWAERNGPPVTPPARKGFGSRLLERGLSHDLGGTVTLNYRPDGFVCTIDFPLSEKLNDERGTIPAAAGVVEDEGLILLTLIDMLEDLGHVVKYEAANVAQALATITEHAQDLDACVLDANLGGQSAITVADELRKSKIPFIVTSGYETRELTRSGLTEQAIAKPYSSRQLAAALASLHPS